MSSKDTFTMHINIVVLGITVISWESLLRVRNVESAIGSSLESSKDTASSSGGTASYIQKGAEGTLVLIHLIDKVGLSINFSGYNFGIDLGVSFIKLIQTNLLQQTSSDKKTGAVRSGIVLETDLESVTAQFRALGLAEDAISINERVGNLANDLGVGESNDEAVLAGLVLVLVLAAETTALTVISATFATTPVLDLVPGEVCLILCYEIKCLERERMRSGAKEKQKLGLD
jgi:hypothetical protein